MLFRPSYAQPGFHLSSLARLVNTPLCKHVVLLLLTQECSGNRIVTRPDLVCAVVTAALTGRQLLAGAWPPCDQHHRWKSEPHHLHPAALLQLGLH
jgi:hypothetical protein